MTALRRLLVLASVAFVVLPASAHSWYDGMCCNENDCRQTTLGEVERHDDGWYIVPTKELIPFGDPRIRQSLDPLIHRCVLSTGQTRCLYVTPPGG